MGSAWIDNCEIKNFIKEMEYYIKKNTLKFMRERPWKSEIMEMIYHRE